MLTVADTLPGAVIIPAPPRSLSGEEAVDNASLTVSLVSGPTLSLWSNATVEGRLQGELVVRLQPHQAVVIGRQEGGQIEYLDPRYHPTRMLPDSMQTVVTSVGLPIDRCVSRGHFMLRGSSQGIVLVNGVPRRGGGIRAPRNGTLLLSPVYRPLGKGEEYLIERGATAQIRLPNQTVIALRAR